MRTVTALDISDSTAVAADVLNSKWFYTAQGVKTQGTATGGGGGGMSTQTGTFTGSGGITAQISCNSAPDEIYIYGDLSGDPSLRGVISLTILKDIVLVMSSDTSQSSVQETAGIVHGISGYNENNQSSEPYASYANGVLTLDMGENTSTRRFVSGITFSYKLISYSGATQHTIHLEFSDSTETDIEVDYDNALIGTMITAYAPSGGWTYNNKLVVEAQLDGVSWYEYSPIPIGVELIDYTAVSSNTAIDSTGAAVTQDWYYASDYTPVDPSMTFSYTAGTWFYIGVYDSSYTCIRAIYVYTDGTVDPNDSNTSHGTLNGSKLTGEAAYVRLCGTWYDDQYMSLVRTA